jgi:Domain of unknown function (DUF4304)
MATEKSELAKTLDELQVELSPALKQQGFCARSRTFNRVTSDRLTEVVKLQMGSFDPPGTNFIPGLRENLYGKFTVNLGVFIPEVAERYGSRASKSFVQEYHCCIRTRLGLLGPERRDVWWNIQRDQALAQGILRRLTRDAIPFFKKFETRDAILNEWAVVPKSLHATTPPRIVCAIILAERGRKEEARVLLTAQAREAQIPGHLAYVRRLANELCLGDLGP